jgi:hypothetical protein
MKFKKASVILFVSVLVLSSCNTIQRPDGNSGILQGMIYDYENKPVSGYVIQAGKNKKTVTDINGRFELAGIRFGLIDISGNSNLHAPYRSTFDFNDKSKILYIRISSNEWLYKTLDRQITNQDFSGCNKTLSLFSEQENSAPKNIFYRTIIQYRESNGSDKGELFNKILELNRKLNHE